MTLWAAIPMRGFACGKSRLAAELDDSARAALNRYLFHRTVGCVVAALGTAQVLVVSPDDAVIAAATALGLKALHERSGAGLNAALALARVAAAECGATALFSVSCDLPLLTGADVVAARKAWHDRGAMLLAPDKTGTGTNAMILPAGIDVAYRMGPDSAANHRAAARRAGLSIVELDCPGFRFDLDTPADLAWWRAGGTTLTPAHPVSGRPARGQDHLVIVQGTTSMCGPVSGTAQNRPE